MDARAIDYFEKQKLEIILFDDCAPIPGTGEENDHAGGGDDMIGSAKVPLSSIVAGCSIHEFFPVLAPGSNTNVGTIEVKIAVMDLESVRQESMSTMVKAA